MGYHVQPGINGIIEDYIKRHQVFLKAKTSLPSEPLLQHEIPKSSWQKVNPNFYEWNDKHWLLVNDYFSKYPFLLKLILLRVPYVINLLEEIFTAERTPADIFTDNAHHLTEKSFPDL